MLEKDMLDREITHFFVFQFRPVLKNVKCKWFRSITNSTLNTLVLEYLIWFGSCEEACGVFVIDNCMALFTWLVASWLLPRLSKQVRSYHIIFGKNQVQRHYSHFSVSVCINTMTVHLIPFPLPFVHITIFVEICSFSVFETKQSPTIVAHNVFKIFSFHWNTQPHFEIVDFVCWFKCGLRPTKYLPM